MKSNIATGRSPHQIEYRDENGDEQNVDEQMDNPLKNTKYEYLKRRVFTASFILASNKEKSGSAL